eukprot:5014034-Prymnesium_polylepis.1
MMLVITMAIAVRTSCQRRRRQERWRRGTPPHTHTAAAWAAMQMHTVKEAVATCRTRLFARVLRASSCIADLRLIVRSTALRASFAASLSTRSSSVCQASVHCSCTSMNTSAWSGRKMARLADTTYSRSRISAHTCSGQRRSHAVRSAATKRAA